MVELREVYGGYGDGLVLNGLSLTVDEGQVVALLGRNGTGKTTTMRAIFGLLPRLAGTITLRGESLRGLPPYAVAARGVALVPQGRRIFPSLTVTENLLIGARPPRADQRVRWTLEEIYRLFPILRERANLRGTLLSGGEQQMLTIARSLMTQPVVLLCDEPSEGLAPVMVQRVAEILQVTVTALPSPASGRCEETLRSLGREVGERRTGGAGSGAEHVGAASEGAPYPVGASARARPRGIRPSRALRA